MTDLGSVSIKEQMNDVTTPLTGHISSNESERIALCGAPILGIPAFGLFIECSDCVELWNFNEVAREA